MTEMLVLIAKDIAMTVGGMAIFVVFFSILAHVYVNMVKN